MTPPHTRTELDNLLTEAETAEYMQVAENTLAKWRVRGEGPPFVKIGRLIRYARGDLARWVEAQRRSSTVDPGPGQGRTR